MRTFISPIGYDTRRVTRPVIKTGVTADDSIVLVRPGGESDTDRAQQAVADVRQFMQEIEPACEIRVEHVYTAEFESTVRECCRIIGGVGDDRETIVLLSGGARDILLPLTVGSLVYAHSIDTALFFSDLDDKVREWILPDLSARIPERTVETFESVVQAEEWLTLSTIAERTGQSKSTIVRHVGDLEDAGVIESDTSEKAKRVRMTFTGELRQLATASQAGFESE